MSLGNLITQLGDRRILLWAGDDGRLQFRSPEGALTPQLRDELVRHKETLIALLGAANGPALLHPLSYPQRSLWFLHQVAPDSTAYHVAIAIRTSTPPRIDALGSALEELIRRHAVLRTTYGMIDGFPFQKIAESLRADFIAEDTTGLNEAELAARIHGAFAQPIDLEHGPILRARLFVSEPESVLLVVVPHLAIDGWSVRLLVDELGTILDHPDSPSITQGEYIDFIQWQRELIAGPEGDRLWQYWQKQLADAPRRLDLPLDRPRPPMQSFGGDSVIFEIDAAAVERIKEVARDEHVTPFVMFLAAWLAALHRFCGSTDLLVGTPVHGRNRPEFTDVFGDFVNMLVLRTQLEPAMTFRQLVARTRHIVLDAIGHQEFPFPLLVERLRPERDPAYPPIVQVFFSFQNLFERGAASPNRLGGTGGVPYPVPRHDAQAELNLEMIEAGGCIRADLKYNNDLFDAATIEQLADLYRQLLAQASTDPGRPLGTFGSPSRRAHMTTAELFAELQRLDIQLWVEGDRLRISAPAGSMTDPLKNQIAAAKSELMELVRLKEVQPKPAPDRAVATGGAGPLSFAQQRLWFMDQLEPGNPAYHVPVALMLKGTLRIDLLKESIAEVVCRHDALRMIFSESAGEPLQQPAPPAPFEFPIDDLEQFPAERREEEAARRILHEAQYPPFDLARGPLWRVRLLRINPEHHYLLLTMHHIISDVWSVAVFLKDLGAAYEALSKGRPPQLPALTISYGDYAASQRRNLTGMRIDDLIDFWRRRLEGSPLRLELPTDRPRPAVQRHAGAYVNTQFDEQLTARLRDLSRERGATLFMTLLAGYAVLLSRYCGQNRLLVGTPFAGRVQPETEALIGLFVNTLALPLDVSADPTFTELIAQAREAFFDAHDHQELPFERLVEALAPERDLSRSPIFQTMFAMQSTGVHLKPVSGLEIQPVITESGVAGARYDLTVSILEYEDDYLHGVFEYDTDLFDETTIRRMIGHYCRLLEAAVENPGLRVSQLSMMTETEEQELLIDFNATSFDHPDLGRRAYQLFEDQARLQPSAIAVECAGERVSYGELNARADELAGRLRQLGAGPDRLVGICLDRSPSMLVAMIAVHKTGAAYVPLDPIYPRERLAYMLEDSGAPLLITEQGLLDRLPEQPGLTRLLVTQDSAPSTKDLALSTKDSESGDLAYVIYTSGSTGKPKGVAVRHGGLTNFLLSMTRQPGLFETDSLLAVTTLCFDIAGLELWGPLCVGGRVVIATRDEAANAERLAQILSEGRMTAMQATPVTWRMLLETGWKGDGRLKAFCGGEALSGELAGQLLDRVGELWNLYGPTETTIWSSIHKVRREDANRTAIQLGRPIANTRLYVLDSESRPLPAGIPGELHIAGDGLARGYLNRPDVTAERFIEHGRYGRLYRTGDLVRWTAADELEYLGRLDNQVKLRGFRIELGEIESALAEIEGVNQAVVVARDDAGGERRLVAYIVWAPGSPAIPTDQLRARLAVRLPDYMVPAAYMNMTALPLTPNGKVDRRSLPEPEIARPKISESYVKPANATEQSIAAVWQEVLHLEQVGVNDNFFDLGGHSLLLLQVQSHLRRTLARELSLVEIFQHPTIHSLAVFVDGVDGGQVQIGKIQERAARQRAVLSES